MHFVEPFFNWRNYYIASEDPSSPFYGQEYSEFEFHNSIYVVFFNLSFKQKNKIVKNINRQQKYFFIYKNFWGGISSKRPCELVII